MLPPRRPWVPLLAALALAVVVCWAGRPAWARRVEWHTEVGMLTGVGLPELVHAPVIGGDATHWWAPHPQLEIGLQTGVGLAVLPYGSNDGEPVFGERGEESPRPLYTAPTLIPRALFGSRLALGASMGLSLFVGPTFFVGDWLGLFSIIPHPTAGLAIDTTFGRDGRFGVRAACSYILRPFSTDEGVIGPTLAFTWR